MDPFSEAVLSMAVISGLFLVGVLSNGFIVLVNFMDWVKGRRVSPADKILVAIGISNIEYSSFSSLYIFYVLLWPQLYLVDCGLPILSSLITYTTLSCSWSSALLCIFYYLKILRFKLRLLSWMKERIDSAVPRLILVIRAVSLTSSLPMIWDVSHDNTSNHTAEVRMNTLYYSLCLGVSSGLSLFLVIFSTVRITWSLCNHMKHMEKSMGPADSSMKVHKRSAQTMLSLLILYLVFYMAEVLNTSTLYIGTTLAHRIIIWVLFSFSPAQALILIFGSTKLRETWQRKR